MVEAWAFCLALHTVTCPKQQTTHLQVRAFAPGNAARFPTPPRGLRAVSSPRGAVGRPLSPPPGSQAALCHPSPKRTIAGSRKAFGHSGEASFSWKVSAPLSSSLR